MILYSKKVTGKGDRYYVSVLVEIPNVKIANNSNGGIGIDLGLKDLAIVSNGKTYKNINKSTRIQQEYPLDVPNHLPGQRMCLYAREVFH